VTRPAPGGFAPEASTGGPLGYASEARVGGLGGFAPEASTNQTRQNSRMRCGSVRPGLVTGTSRLNR
jgi:hypothetical protein